MFDLVRNLKFINDTYGHAAGDKVLVAMGQILKDIFRTDDIVVPTVIFFKDGKEVDRLVGVMPPEAYVGRF